MLRYKSKGSWVATILAIYLILAINSLGFSYETEVHEATLQFINSIKNNGKDFEKIISPQGLIVIRNFVTGGSGTRGKDVRYFYTANKIPANLSFSVKDESPIVFSQLFEKVIKKDVKTIKTINVKDICFLFKDDGEIIYPPTSEVIQICTEIQKIEKETNMGPRIFILGEKEFALTEAEMFLDDLSVGSWAVFNRVDSRYYLRAVMDFR